MPGTVATGSDNIKKVMRIALIGIKPADQVILKGYLRVILRLEADLEWVTATHPNVDLYMINQEFQEADSIKTLLKNNETCAVIFVDRCDNDNGSMDGNRLTMPLQEVSYLSLWLNDNVALLGGSYTPSVTDAPTPKQAKKSAGNTAQPAHRLSAVIELINLIRQRRDTLMDLYCGSTLVATIYPKALQVIVHDNPQFDVPWQLQANQQNANLFAQKVSIDLNQWLWQQAWQHPDYFAELIRKDLLVQLTSWPKPQPDDESRRQLLKLFTLIETSAMSIRQLSSAIGLDVQQTKAQVVALFVAGLLNKEAYQTVLALFEPQQIANDRVKQTSQPSATDEPAEAASIEINYDELEPNPAAEQAVADEHKQAHQQDDEKSSAKVGFLSRLRQKLGL